MKKIITIVFFFIVLLNEKATSQVGVSVDFNTFYTSLSPYGRWVTYPTYGQVWVYNTRGFRPYYDGGHWVYTDYGWTWVSDYEWGWAPFHYGRWVPTPDYGWVWVPGYEWAPAWVGWCDGDGYYGWAPLSPGLSVDVSFNEIPAERWCFVQHQYINSPSLRSHFIDNSRNVTIYKNVTVINNVQVNNNTRYVAGPRREDVEKVTHRPIQQNTISYAQRPGRTIARNNRVNIYRPDVKSANPVPNNNRTPNNNNKPVVPANHNAIRQQQRIQQQQVQQQSQQRQVQQQQAQQREVQQQQRQQQRQQKEVQQQLNQQRQAQQQQRQQQIQQRQVQQQQQAQQRQAQQQMRQQQVQQRQAQQQQRQQQMQQQQVRQQQQMQERQQPQQIRNEPRPEGRPDGGGGNERKRN